MAKLPREIDLTENMQFSDGNWLPEDGVIALDVDFIDRYDGEFMSTEDFEKFKRWESLFGKRRHENRKRYAFCPTDTSDDAAFYDRMRDYCPRCGKYINDKWNRRGNLCKECDEYMQTDRTRFPWVRDIYGLVSNVESDGRDIFNLR